MQLDELLYRSGTQQCHQTEVALWKSCNSPALGVKAISKEDPEGAQSTTLWLCQACCTSLHALVGGPEK